MVIAKKRKKHLSTSLKQDEYNSCPYIELRLILLKKGESIVKLKHGNSPSLSMAILPRRNPSMEIRENSLSIFLTLFLLCQMWR